MWCVLDLNGDEVHWNHSWDGAVRWAMRNGGEFDVVFRTW